MGQVGCMCDCKGMRYLYSEEVHHSDQLFRDNLRQQPKISCLDPIINVVISFTVLSQLQVQKLVLVYLIGIDNVWCLGRYIYPRVNNTANLLISGVWCPTESSYLMCVDDFEDELVVDIGLHAQLWLLNTYEALWRYDVKYLEFLQVLGFDPTLVELFA